MTNRVNMRLSLVMTAAALVTLAGGCDDRSTPADKAIHAQAREMSALSADGPAPAAASVEKATLTKVNTELTPAISSSISGEKSAASMLTAQSNLNLAEHAMGEAGRAERDCGIIIAEVDGHLSRWRSHQAIKVAAESFNPSAEIAEIATRKTAKDGEIAKERANKAKLESQLNDLKGKAKEKMDAVANREAEYGKLMEQAARLSATQGVALVEQANGIRREADLLRMAGTKLEAQAGVIEPQVRESEAIINQLVNQKKDMESTEAALAAQVSERQKEAADAAKAANDAAAKVTEAMGRLKEARDKTEVAYNSAQSLYTKAVSNAREASRDSATSGKAMLGDAYVGSGFMQWQRSQGLRVYAALLESLAKVEPALSDRAKFAADAKNATEEATKAIGAAGEALEQASNTFGGVQAQGASKERLNKLKDLLTSAMSVSKDTSTHVSDELAKLAGMNGAPATMNATPAPASTPSAAAPAAPATGDAEQIVAVLKQAQELAKAKKYTDIFALTHVPPEQKPMMDLIGSLLTAVQKGDDACKAKYNKTLSEVLEGLPGMDQLVGFDKTFSPLTNLPADVTPEAIQLKVTGDTAEAQIPGDRTPTHFVKIDGAWRLTEKSKQDPAQVKMMMAQMKPIVGVIEAFTTDVQAGKYPDVAAAKKGFMATLQAKMMGGG